MFYRIFYLLLLVFFSSCECPPNLDTDKELIPNEFSNIFFINRFQSHSSVNVYSRKLELLKNLSQSTYSETSYTKFPSGFSNMIFTSNSNIIFNTVIYSKKNSYYTLIMYESSDQPQILLLNDTNPDSLNNTSFRIVNLTQNIKVLCKIISSLPQAIEVNLNNNEFTNLIPFATGIINLEVYDYETKILLVDLKDIKLNLNSVTNFILQSDNEILNISVGIAKKF